MFTARVVLAFLLACCTAVAQQYTITTVAGGFWPNNVQATNAGIFPLGLTVDGLGNIFWSDSSAVYRVGNDSVLRSIAGGPNVGYAGDGGSGTQAQFNQGGGPAIIRGGLTLDAVGNLYIADTANNRIRRLNASDGRVDTIAGIGLAGFSGDGGPAVAAQLYNPASIAIDKIGNFYIADVGNVRVRKIDASTGLITTVAGNGIFGYTADGGPATQTSIQLGGIAITSDNNLLIASGARLRQVSLSSGQISTIAGTGISGYSGDNGPASLAQINVGDVAVDVNGSIYLADPGRIRKIDYRTKTVSTIGGTGRCCSGPDGPDATQSDMLPTRVAVDATGSVYAIDVFRIRKIVQGGGIRTIAGTTWFTFGGDGGSALMSQLANPTGVATSSNGDLFIADRFNSRVRRVAAGSGFITTVAGTDDYVLDFTGDGGPANRAKLGFPWTLALDQRGNLFVNQGCSIRRIDANTNVIATYAGRSGPCGYSGDGGQAMDAKFAEIRGIATDSSGNLVVADMNNHLLGASTRRPAWC